MTFRGLRDAGVLGINARNSELIARYNPRANYPRVDDKLLTKQLAQEAGIAVPKLIGVIAAYGDIAKLSARLEGVEEFALKPVNGAQGNGVVVARRDGQSFLRSDGVRLTRAELEEHVASILAGLYSLGGRVDRAMLEERLVTHPAFDSLSVGGVPDIRMIVFRGVPIMAMTRLPTLRSRGRANLHQGAVAVGLDLATGRATGGVWRNRPIDRHPDSGAVLRDLAVPQWEELLVVAARCGDVFELGYIGVDLVLDARRGPVLLEANARPGLAIQLANGAGLWPRIRAVQRMELPEAAEQRAALCRTIG